MQLRAYTVRIPKSNTLPVERKTENLKFELANDPVNALYFSKRTDVIKCVLLTAVKQ